jgi:hypothetical protein
MEFRYPADITKTDPLARKFRETVRHYRLHSFLRGTAALLIVAAIAFMSLLATALVLKLLLSQFGGAAAAAGGEVSARGTSQSLLDEGITVILTVGICALWAAIGLSIFYLLKNQIARLAPKQPQLPCPFCGHQLIDEEDDHETLWLCCPSCQARGLIGSQGSG